MCSVEGSTLPVFQIVKIYKEVTRSKDVDYMVSNILEKRIDKQIGNKYQQETVFSLYSGHI